MDKLYKIGYNIQDSLPIPAVKKKAKLFNYRATKGLWACDASSWTLRYCGKWVQDLALVLMKAQKIESRAIMISMLK